VEIKEAKLWIWEIKTIQLLKWSQVTIVWKKALALAEQYPVDLNGKVFITEMQHLPAVHKVNFECAQFNTNGPVELNNTVQSENSRKLPL